MEEMSYKQILRPVGNRLQLQRFIKVVAGCVVGEYHPEQKGTGLRTQLCYCFVPSVIQDEPWLPLVELAESH